MSKSGIERRSGFRNRSKSSLCSSGSTRVMSSEYATKDPAPEPRPGPTGMTCHNPHARGVVQVVAAAKGVEDKHRLRMPELCGNCHDK